MRYATSDSNDYDPHRVVVRDFKSEPPGRVLCIVARDNHHEAEQIAQLIADLLNNYESKKDELGTV
jgi:hypothetical protein